MNNLYMILGLAVIILVLIRVYVRAGRMGFEGFAGSGGAEVVIAKWEQCGHCIKAKPEFDALAERLPEVKLRDGSSVTLRTLDADSDKDEIASLGIKGYPTILFFKDGQRFEYNQHPPTADGIISFLKGY
jgi:thiol-disulfide isomerase/thioredoxin